METPTDKIKDEPKTKVKVKTEKKGKASKSSNKATSQTLHSANGKGSRALPKPGEEYMLDEGILVKFHRISAPMIREAQSAIPDPDTKQYNFTHPETGISAFNPDHPEYKMAVEAVEVEREQAAMDIMVAMGIELVNGMPEAEEWERVKSQLLWMQKKKRIDISDLDLEDELDREFAYKKYVVADVETFRILNALNGYSSEGIANQAKSFQGDA